jgi:hypothetical protein
MKNMLDSDGYPTEEILDTISNWHIEEDYMDLIELIRDLWKWSDWGVKVGKEQHEQYANGIKMCRMVELHTGGWSGNEAIVHALKRNKFFWAVCWVKSERGGHHTFEIKIK